MRDALPSEKRPMRTTLTIDDDVLAAAKGLAARQGKTVGDVLSALARQALQPASPRQLMRNGILLLQVGEKPIPVTQDLVNQLRDELP